MFISSEGVKEYCEEAVKKLLVAVNATEEKDSSCPDCKGRGWAIVNVGSIRVQATCLTCKK